MQRILILMATRTYRAEAFLSAAARLGVEVTVGSDQEHILAALTPGASLALDFRDLKQARRRVLEFAAQHPIDAVVGVDDDSTLVAAVAAEALGLPHNNPESVKASRFKDVMRLILAETELNSPPFELVALDDDPREVAARQPFPVVLKPLSLSASRGVIRADNGAEFERAFREVAQIIEEAALPVDDPGARQILVEGFIPGREVALEGLLRGGDLSVLALFDKPDPLDGPYFEETIYVTPSRLPDETQAAIARAAAQAARAIGLRDGPVHVELRVNDRGAWVVEVAARSIGGRCSNSLRFDFNLSLEEIILRNAAGLALPELRREGQAAGAMMIPIPRGGTLCAVRGRAEALAVPGVEEVTISIPIGGEVVPLPRATRYLGFIIARAGTPAAVEAALREAHRRLEFEIG